MAAHPWLSMSIEQLLEIALRDEYPPTHPSSVALQLLIRRRLNDQQLQAAAQNAKSGEHLADLTAGLVRMTKALVRATWAVAIVTAIAALATVVPIFLKCTR